MLIIFPYWKHSYYYFVGWFLLLLFIVVFLLCCAKLMLCSFIKITIIVIFIIIIDYYCCWYRYIYICLMKMNINISSEQLLLFDNFSLNIALFQSPSNDQMTKIIIAKNELCSDAGSRWETQEQNIYPIFREHIVISVSFFISHLLKNNDEKKANGPPTACFCMDS